MNPLKTLLFSVFALSVSICFGQINPTNNKIGVDVSTYPQNASFNYDSCFDIGTNLGMSQVGIYQNWTAVETAPHVFNMVIFDIADYYYPLHNMPIDLTIAPIHTNNLEVPTDLATTDFDNAVFIDRFEILLDSIKAHIPNVTLSSLVIGSEHDVYLGSNSTKWTQYTTFYDSVSTYAKKLWPGLKVATELTFNGITSQNTFAQALNTTSDYIGVSYYPLNNNFTVKPVSAVPTDVASLVTLYPSKPICFYQYGYPSSAVCNSSDHQQAQFIAKTFQVWDTYASNIRLIDFTWLHDLDADMVNYYGTYYGITDAIFLQYLHTLGLRNWNGNGSDKPAMEELRCQATRRGYNDLNINCKSVIAGVTETQAGVTLFPNPANDKLFISFDNNDNATLKMIDQLGKEVLNQQITHDEHQFAIDISHLPSGLYLVHVTTDQNTRFIQRMMIVE